MKYDKAFFHQQLLKLQSVSYDKYCESEDVDVLIEYISEGKITDYDAIVWTECRKYLVSSYSIGTGHKIMDNQQVVTADEINVGLALEDFINYIQPLTIRVKVLIYLRDNAHKIFDRPTVGLEDFESEIVRLISNCLKKAKDKNLYNELLELVQKGIYNPAENTQESELITLKKKNQELARENNQLKRDLDALKKKYDELQTRWDNRNKRKRPIKYGISSDFQNDQSLWVIDQLIRNDIICNGQMYYGEKVYIWKKSKSLFAFFVDRFTEQCNLRDTNEQIPWRMFEGTFVPQDGNSADFYKGLKDLVSKYRKSGNIPQNDDVIERILKEAKTKPWLKAPANPK